MEMWLLLEFHIWEENMLCIAISKPNPTHWALSLFEKALGHLVVWVCSTRNNLTLPSRINQTETRFDENLQWKWQATHPNTDSIPFQWGCHILFCMTSISPGGAYFKREKNLIRVIFLWFLVIRLCYLPAGLLRNFSTWTKMKNWYYLVFRA